MGGLSALIRQSGGAAAAEMALITPLLLTIMFGSVEMGNYFMNEHALIKAVRDGARFAARKPFTNFSGCSATATDVPATLKSDVLTLVRKGTLDSTKADRLMNWDDAKVSFSVKSTCATSASGQTFGGIYSGNSVGTANAGPVVIVSAVVPYRPILGYKLIGLNLNLRANEQAAVVGI